jgi:drug/metabolite transporter (DMT)-like permease
MSLGYILLFTSLIAFALLGIFHKVADHPQCRPKMIAVILLFWGGVLATAYTAAFDEIGLRFPREVLLIGSLAGVIAALALFVFQTGLKFGKISTSWLIINLATAVPVLLSVFLFGERINVAKIAGIVLVLAAIVMMWWDKRIDLDREAAQATGEKKSDKSKWLPLMLLAFVGQGLAMSSQKLLVEAGASKYAWQFLIVLYWSGFTVMVLLSLLREAWPNRRELLTGLVMAVCSVIGNVSITKAMADVPAVVAYPVGNGGTLTLVVLAGVLFFKERIHRIGLAGIVCGVSAILVLIWPEK